MTSILSVRGTPTEIYCRDADAPIFHLLIIPGNPGLIDFYRSFIDSLFEKMEGRVTVVGVGHAGHLRNRNATNDKAIYSLGFQVDHKSWFIEDHVPPAQRVVLAGHSIGAWMCLELHHKYPSLRVERVMGLMPTVERLWQGLAPMVKVAVQPGIRHLFCTIAHFLPKSLLLGFLNLKRALGGSDFSFEHMEVIFGGLFHYNTLLNALCMAHEESHSVTSFPEVLIEHACSKLFMLYSPSDPYTPTPVFEAMNARLPEGRVHQTNDEVEHAFCLHHSEAVSDICVNNFLSDVL